MGENPAFPENIIAKVVSWLHQTIPFKFFQAGKSSYSFGGRNLEKTLGLNQTYRGRADRTVGMSYSKRQKPLQDVCAGAEGLPYANIHIFTNPNKCLLPEKDYLLVSSVASGRKLGCAMLQKLLNIRRQCPRTL